MGKLMEKIATEFREQSCAELMEMMNQLESGIGQLSDEQLWQHDGEHEHAIGDLILDLCGNMRQWVLHGFNDDTDEWAGDTAFACKRGQGGKELMEQFRAVTTEVMQEIRELPKDRLLDWVTEESGKPAMTILASMSEGIEDAHWHVSQAILQTEQMVGRGLGLMIRVKR